MNLSQKQATALESLLQGHTHATAAKAAGVVASTVGRWCEVPVFAAALRRGSDDALWRAVVLLKVTAVEAVKRLIAEMESDAPLAVRVSAADKLLTHAVRLSEAVELKAEIEILKAKLAELSEGPHIARTAELSEGPYIAMTA